jgi:hypothetical protein
MHPAFSVILRCELLRASKEDGPAAALRGSSLRAEHLRVTR